APQAEQIELGLTAPVKVMVITSPCAGMPSVLLVVRLATAAAAIVNVLLVAVSDAPVAVSEYAVPLDLSILQPAKAATPLLLVATGLVVQVSVAPAAPVPPVIARETEVPETGLPLTSKSVSCGCVVSATPSVEQLGCVLKLNVVAVPAVMLKLLALVGALCDGLLEAVSV